MLTLSMAGPKPFQRARTPSAAIVLRAQSRSPLYVPVGADWILDLSTYSKISAGKQDNKNAQHTSGGMAKAHMATPAVPPATMMAPRLSSEGEAPAGVKALFVTS